VLETLQAMQAAVVYGMLCSQCTESVSVDDAAWIVEVIEVCFRYWAPYPVEIAD
jgi:hypothetical protein